MPREGWDFPKISSVEHSEFSWEREPKVTSVMQGLISCAGPRIPLQEILAHTVTPG